jgi:hypothetical protein
VSNLSFDRRDATFAAVAFAGLIIFFIVLAKLAGWPNAQNGWSLAVILAVVIALLPTIARTLTFLQQSRASIEAPFGVKISFANAIIGADVKTLPENLVQPGAVIAESGVGELDRAAQEAAEQTVVVIDLEDGQAWYWTRLFAVAATAALLGAPKLMVLVGRRGGLPRRLGGWIRPRDFVRAVTQHDPRYDWVWRRARDYLNLLRCGNQPAPSLPRQTQYEYTFREIGDPAVMKILVDQMQNPEPMPSGSNPPPLEDPNAPPWAALADAEARLCPWLVRAAVDLGTPERERLKAILSTQGEIAVATRDGEFAGIIDVERAERQILRQLAEKVAAG